MRESESAVRTAPDTDVLEFATGEHRGLVRVNRRVRLRRERPDQAGIVVRTLDLDYAALASGSARRSPAAPLLRDQLRR